MKPLIILFLLSFLINTCTEQKAYLDTKRSVEERVNDLVSRMTLEEKIQQMGNQAPAIERLGIAEYNWWSEALHGVARAGLATVFPQAIGLAATWDEELMLKVSTAISDEARAKHHEFERRGKRFLYQGLSLWSPNINIFRDPRWGRGQETYGEDPFLSGRMAVQFINGLQGNNPKYFKTIATVKHFAVHNGPEPERHVFNAQIGKKDLVETYLPQFEMGIKEARAYSLMCAYNRYNGEACCGSRGLLTDLLRNDWGFNGYVVSDCFAIEDFYKHHKILDTPQESAALAVKSGTDLNCGSVYQLHLADAVKQGYITETEIDVAVKRLFTARFKLGMFDPPAQVQYTQIPYKVVDSKEHQQLALETARKSIVLLKNDKKILPLKKDAGTIAVIGPNSDKWLMLLGNYNGVPSDPVTPLRGIRGKVTSGTKVLYAQGSELAEGIPMFDIIPPEVLYGENNSTGLKVDFYNNKDFKGDILFSEVTENLDVNWNDKTPREDMDDDNFGVKWSGFLKPIISGTYQLGIITDCNTNLYFEDSLMASTPYHFRNEYGDPRLRKTDPLRLEAGKTYKLSVEASETYADAMVQLVWATPEPNLKKEAIEIARQADVVVMCMGLTARIEGEEMDIAVDGFRGGDRTKIGLPQVQEDLIKEIHKLGKPVVLVLLNGSALAVNWADKNIPAIIEAWYPGQAGGSAIADVLFGDYNPSGRLPVTFYKSEKDLPPFEEYRMIGHTYRFFKGDVLYPFGYGLSYTSFDYSNFTVPENVKAGDTLMVMVTVKNSGSRDGEEVVQVYASKLNDSAAPLRNLVAFKRVFIKQGEEKEILLKIRPESFTTVTNDGERKFIPAEFLLTAGGGQPLKGIKTLSSILSIN
jgi:beta-glucosidase